MNVNFQRHPGIPRPPIPRLLLIFFRFFFSILPTDLISGNAFDAKQQQKKKQKERGGAGGDSLNN